MITMTSRLRIISLAAVILLIAAVTITGCTNTAPAATATTPAPTASQTSAQPLIEEITVRAEIAALAASYAAQINGDNVTAAIAGGANSTEHAALVARLAAMIAENPQIAWVEIATNVNGTYQELAAPEGNEPVNESEPEVIQPEFLQPITAPGATGVYTDRWGTSVSGYAPIADGSGKAVAFLMVDVPFEVLQNETRDLAVSYADLIDPVTLAAAIENGENSTEYGSIVDQLEAFVLADNRTGYISILRHMDGKILFVTASSYNGPDNPDRYPGQKPGDEITDEAPELLRPVTAPGATSIFFDGFDSELNGYAPIRDANGQVIAFLVFDRAL